MKFLENFIDFIKKNITINILASLLTYNILNTIVNNIISPIIFTFADPKDSIDNLNFTTDGVNIVKIGTFIKSMIVGLTLLFVLSQIKVVDGN
jgi:large-conductance mechanosensitive channel